MTLDVWVFLKTKRSLLYENWARGKLGKIGAGWVSSRNSILLQRSLVMAERGAIPHFCFYLQRVSQIEF